MNECDVCHAWQLDWVLLSVASNGVRVRVCLRCFLSSLTALQEAFGERAVGIAGCDGRAEARLAAVWVRAPAPAPEATAPAPAQGLTVRRAAVQARLDSARATIERAEALLDSIVAKHRPAG